jgi:hypothetical protein
MSKRRKLDFIVDKLTNSIENTLTGQKVETVIELLSMGDAEILQKLKWDFNWVTELEKPKRKVYALVIKSDPSVFQGLVSSEDFHDHIFFHLLESAPVNKGHNKLYAGVAGNLVAFLCKTSFEMGYGGNVVFEPKTRLIEHYKNTLGAQLITRSRMLIDTKNALLLVKKYFPNFVYDRL